MIAEIGHFALVLAFALALYQTVVPLYGAHRGDGALMRTALPAAFSQLGLIAIAFAALTWAYVTSDFTVENVWANSHTAKPLLYKFAGVWGNHEGSMVLWVLILALFGAAVALFGSNLPLTLRSRVLGVQGSIGAAFLLGEMGAATAKGPAGQRHRGDGEEKGQRLARVLADHARDCTVLDHEQLLVGAQLGLLQPGGSVGPVPDERPLPDQGRHAHSRLQQPQRSQEPHAAAALGLVGTDLAQGLVPEGFPSPAQCRTLTDGSICTLDEVAHRAEFGKGTIYNYFEGGKEEILFAIFDELYDAFCELIAATFDPARTQGRAFRDVFHGFVRSCFDFFTERQDQFLLLIKEAQRLIFSDDHQKAAYFQQQGERIVGMLVPPLEAAMATGELRSLPAHAVAHMIFGNIKGYQTHACLQACHAVDSGGVKQPPEFSAEKAADFITTLMLDGLLTRAGIGSPSYTA